MPCCPHCGDTVPDIISHHLTHHPHNPVPAHIVREMIEGGPTTRCRICYVPVTDPVSHYMDHHVRTVRVLFGGGCERDVSRDPDERFSCPWCPQRIQDPIQFLVSTSAGLGEQWGTANALAETRRALSRTRGLAKLPSSKFLRERVCRLRAIDLKLPIDHELSRGLLGRPELDKHSDRLLTDISTLHIASGKLHALFLLFLPEVDDFFFFLEKKTSRLIS